MIIVRLRTRTPVTMEIENERTVSLKPHESIAIEFEGKWLELEMWDNGVVPTKSIVG